MSGNNAIDPANGVQSVKIKKITNEFTESVMTGVT